MPLRGAITYENGLVGPLMKLSHNKCFPPLEQKSVGSYRICAGGVLRARIVRSSSGDPPTAFSRIAGASQPSTKVTPAPVMATCSSKNRMPAFSNALIRASSVRG